MAKKDFKGAADSYFTEKLTPPEVAPETPIAQTTPITPKAPKDTKRLNLYIDTALITDIKKIAGIEGKSVNGLICEVLAEYAKTKAEAIKAYNDYHNNNE